MKALALPLAVAALLTGCASHGFYQWQASMLDGAPFLKSESGTFVTPRCPSVVRDGKWVTFTCTPVTIQAEPPGLEAYSYVSRLPITCEQMAASMRETCACPLTRLSDVQVRSGFEVS